MVALVCEDHGKDRIMCRCQEGVYQDSREGECVRKLNNKQGRVRGKWRARNKLRGLNVGSRRQIEEVHRAVCHGRQRLKWVANWKEKKEGNTGGK